MSKWLKRTKRGVQAGHKPKIGFNHQGLHGLGPAFTPPFVLFSHLHYGACTQ